MSDSEGCRITTKIFVVLLSLPVLLWGVASLLIGIEQFNFVGFYGDEEKYAYRNVQVWYRRAQQQSIFFPLLEKEKVGRQVDGFFGASS